MSTLAKPTAWYRRTVDSIGRVFRKDKPEGWSWFVLGPSEHTRRVTLALPHSPQVYVSLDETPDDIARGRNYQWPEPPTGRTLTFLLMPGQHICAIADEKVADVSVLVEYLA